MSGSTLSCCSIVILYIKISSAMFVTQSISARTDCNIYCNSLGALFTPNIKRLYCLALFSVWKTVIYLDSSSESSWWRADLRSNFVKCFSPFNFTRRLPSVGTGYWVRCIAWFAQLMSIQILTLSSSLFTATNSLNQGVEFLVTSFITSFITSCCSSCCNSSWTYSLSENGICL